MFEGILSPGRIQKGTHRGSGPECLRTGRGQPSQDSARRPGIGGRKQSTSSTRGCLCQLRDPQQPSDGVARPADTDVLTALQAGSPRPGWAGSLPPRPHSLVCRRLSPPCVLTWHYLCVHPASSLLFLLFSPKVMSSSLQHHVLQHARLPCSSLSPRVAQIYVS